MTVSFLELHDLQGHATFLKEAREGVKREVDGRAPTYAKDNIPIGWRPLPFRCALGRVWNTWTDTTRSPEGKSLSSDSYTTART